MTGPAIHAGRDRPPSGKRRWPPGVDGWEHLGVDSSGRFARPGRATARRHRVAVLAVSHIGYARVSTCGQADNGQSLDAQRESHCRGCAVADVFPDGVSGARDDRPALGADRERAQPGDLLVVTKLDRLGRSVVHLLTVIEDLQARSVEFRSLGDAITTTTPPRAGCSYTCSPPTTTSARHRVPAAASSGR